VVLATGLFDAADDGGVIWRGAPVPAIDVAALYAQAEAAAWAERASRTSQRPVREPEPPDDEARWTVLPEPPSGPGVQMGGRS
jgi:hypothetical protein